MTRNKCKQVKTSKQWRVIHWFPSLLLINNLRVNGTLSASDLYFIYFLGALKEKKESRTVMHT